jgi:hypothetical protein
MSNDEPQDWDEYLDTKSLTTNLAQRAIDRVLVAAEKQ